MAYTDIDKVRLEAWMQHSNIHTSTINTYINRAHAQVMSLVWQLYDVSQLTWPNRNNSLWYLVLSDAETLIASGYLLFKEYGNEQIWWPSGREKLEEWRHILNQIQMGKIRLIWLDNFEFPRIGQGVSSPVVSATNTTTQFTKDMKW